MKINQLILQNFRRYELAHFQFHPKFTTIIGNNGAGKTTVLDALAFLLNTYFFGLKIPAGGGSIKQQDAKYVFRKNEGQPFKEHKSDVYIEAKAECGGHPISWRRDIGDRGAKAKDIIKLGENARNSIEHQSFSDLPLFHEPKLSPDLPLFLYYGAARLWNTNDNINTAQPSSQLDAYRNCLNPRSDQKSFEEWFKNLTYIELQKRTEIPALAAIRDAISNCIPGASELYYDTEYSQIVIKLDKEGFTPFNSLSDGYRNMVAMVADIAHRASRLNPHHGTEAAQKTAGVVLIDEIDLHLHPKWQRRVVMDLQRAFPNLQFIATTHSPFILQSMQPGQVIDLDRVDASINELNLPEGVAAPGPGSDFSHRSIEDIVESVMGIPLPQRSERRQKMYEAAREYYGHFSKPQKITHQHT